MKSGTHISSLPPSPTLSDTRNFFFFLNRELNICNIKWSRHVNKKLSQIGETFDGTIELQNDLGWKGPER